MLENLWALIVSVASELGWEVGDVPALVKSSARTPPHAQRSSTPGTNLDFLLVDGDTRDPSKGVEARPSAIVLWSPVSLALKKPAAKKSKSTPAGGSLPNARHPRKIVALIKEAERERKEHAEGLHGLRVNSNSSSLIFMGRVE